MANISVIGNDLTIYHAFASLANAAPGATNFNIHRAYIKDYSLSSYMQALNDVFVGFSDKAMGDLMVANLGLGAVVSSAEAEAYLASAPDRVAAVLDLAKILSNYSGTNADVLAAQTTFSNKIGFAVNYSAANNAQSNFPDTFAGSSFMLTTGIDTLVGTADADLFNAYILNNANSLNSNDNLQGGAGIDTLFADIGTSANFAITAVTTGIETVQIRGEAIPFDGTNGNNTSSGAFGGLVQIDAERMSGVNQWESNNSRSDVVIEDVHIGDAQKTSDITIAFVESDPGNVDMAVYFEQAALRNASSGTTSITIRLMDTGAAAAADTAATPLLNNPYDTFKFAINGVMQTITLDPVAVAAADTYEALLTVFQASLAGSSVTAALGANFTVTDPLSGKPVTGKDIVLTGGSGNAITTPAGSGWFNTTGASVPAKSNIYTFIDTGSTNVTELVTSKVILDDVGSSNMGGDLVIGGMSTGDTSNYSIYRGVERFEIEVRDNSKLQTMNSTNNALREVTIVNGLTSKTVAEAYTTTTKDEGDLVVNGDAATNLALTNTATQIRGQSYAVPVGGLQSGGNTQMPGVENNSPVGIHHGAGAAGFTDVRLIDASAFKGKLGFTAAITADSIAKYVNLIDVAPALPAADIAGEGNVNFGVRGANFIYTGGNDDDTMTVTIDGAAASSRSTVVSGQSDFTFAFNGGAGNDALTVNVINGALAGGAQAWYNNQKLNANIAIGAGDGDDTVKTPGAGDVVIDAGAGNDTVYTDNTGNLGATATANGASTAAAIAYTNAAAAELASAQAAWVSSNTLGGGYTSGKTGLTVTTAAAKVAALDILDQLTPTGNTALPVISHAAIATATANAVAAGAITFDQKVTIDLAYGAITAAGTVTPAAAIETAATYAGATAAVVVNVTQPELTAGDAVVAGIMATLRAEVAANAAAAANDAYQATLLNATQAAVVAANKAVNQVFEPADGWAVGSAVQLAGLTTLQAALVNGTTNANAIAAINTAIQTGAITTGVQAGGIAAAAGAAGAGSMDAAEAAAVLAILSPLKNAATIANNTDQATLTAALAADALAVNTAAAFAAANPTLGDGLVDVGGAPNESLATSGDAIGSSEAATAAKTAADASSAAAKDLAAAQAINTALEGLKAAVNVGALAADITNALANASAAGAAAAASATVLNGGTGVVVDLITPAVGGFAALVPAGLVAPGLIAADELTFDTGALGIFDATAVNSIIINNNVVIAELTAIAADKAAVAAATAKASTIAAAAAVSGGADLTIASPKAVFVFDTANQAASYNRLTMDDRNLADLKSDANNSNNFFNSTLKVTFKGIESSVTVAGTGYKTTDLELNQSIKQAINSDAVLSKLLLATDGPANSLVVTSLIDGAQVTGNLAVTVTLPTTVTAADIAGATTAYGLAAGATEAQVLAAMTTAKTAFDAKGDYVTQFAESGAAGGNVDLVGANSTSSSDNTITLGSGNDVLVLGTTVGTDAMTSSNEKVIYSGSFGNDTVVNFDVSGNGIDMLDFTALNGSGNVALNSLSLDKSIVIAAPTAAGATVLTNVQIAALFTDSATAINHVYVAVDSTNIGSVWQVADAAGTAAGNVVATLVGSIDLADTAWGTLTAANFA